MNSMSLQSEIDEFFKKLAPEQQRKVLEFARALESSKPLGVPGHELFSFEGAISSKDLNLMKKAIEEDCEKVVAHEW